MIKGIDISHWQGRMNWDKVANNGMTFMFAKCTDGATYKDSQYILNITNAKKAGLITGAYHFFHPKQSLSQQAGFFYTQTRKAIPDLPPVIDVEVHDGLSNAQVKTAVLAFIEKVTEKFGKQPIIYSRDGLVKAWGLEPYTSNPNLYWKALYSNKFSGRDAKFWQFSETFRIPGVPNALDGDYFQGTAEELQAMTAGNIPVPEPQPIPEGKHGRVAVDRLNIRSGAGIEYRVVGQLRKGDWIEIQGIEDERWARIADGYCALFGEAGIFVNLQ